MICMCVYIYIYIMHLYACVCVYMHIYIYIYMIQPMRAHVGPCWPTIGRVHTCIERLHGRQADK